MEIEKGAGKQAKTLRVLILDKPGYLGKLTSAIGMAGSNIGDIRLVRMGMTHNTREMTIYVDSDEQLEHIFDNLSKVEGIIVEEVIDLVHQMHEGGKIAMKSKLPIKNIGDIRKIYTPGVAAICRDIQKKPELAWRYTAIHNQVAIVTNGTAILGLGDIGAVAGMPVMEGKAALFDHLVRISGIPILIQNRDPQVIIETVKNIAPTFGAIKLEDIAAPECFAIEDALDEMLDIPVMHDDQHGTAVVVLAALLNATRFSGQMLNKSAIGVIGLGAAGIGISKLLLAYGVKSVIGTDLKESAGEMLQAAGGKSGSLQEVMAAGQYRHRNHRLPGADQAGDGPQRPGHPGPVQSQSGDPAGRSGAGWGGLRRRRQERQQRSGLPRHFPRRPERARHPHQQQDENRRGPGNSRLRRRGGTGPLHSPPGGALEGGRGGGAGGAGVRRDHALGIAAQDKRTVR